MPIMVIFDPVDSHCDPTARPVELGPFRVAQLNAGRLMVFDGFQPFTLAVLEPDGNWTVNGLDGMKFPSVRFMPPTKQARRDLDRAEKDYDAEE